MNKSTLPNPSPATRMKLVILDRDGVINFDSASYIKSPDEWKPIPGSLEAIALLNQAGYHVVVATNQAGVGRGLFEMATLNAIHDKMHRALGQPADTSTPYFSVRTHRTPAATAANPTPACSRKSRAASTSVCRACPASAMRYATWKLRRPSAHSRSWS